MLVTAHTTKAGADEKPFGSVFWHNGARLTWHVSREQESGDDLIRVGLVNRKHNDGRLARPLGWEVTFGDGIAFERVDASSIAGVAERMSIAQRIRAELVAGSRTIHELAETIGGEPGSVRTTVDREVKRGKLVKFPGEGAFTASDWPKGRWLRDHKTGCLRQSRHVQRTRDKTDRLVYRGV